MPDLSRGHQTSSHRSRLAALLARRDLIGAQWAESLSHGSEATSALTFDLMVVEATLTDGWPGLAEDWVGEWAAADIKKLHDPDAGPKPGCSVCERRSRPISA